MMNRKVEEVLINEGYPFGNGANGFMLFFGQDLIDMLLLLL